MASSHSVILFTDKAGRKPALSVLSHRECDFLMQPQTGPGQKRAEFKRPLKHYPALEYYKNII